MEDTTMSEDKQCLQRDITEVYVARSGAGRTRVMFVVKSRRMMSTCHGQDQETNVGIAYMLLHSNLWPHGVCYTEVLFQPSFYSERAHVACRT